MQHNVSIIAAPGELNWDTLIPRSDDAIEEVHGLYLLLGAFICTFGFLSLVIKEKLYMSEALVSVVVGIIIGPIVARRLMPADTFGVHLDSVTLEFTRLVVALQCMAAGVDLPGCRF